MSFLPGDPQKGTGIPERSVRAIRTPHRVVCLVFDDVTTLDVAGPMEVFHQADRVGYPYETVLANQDGAAVTTSSGMLLGGVVAVDAVGPMDMLLVPGSDHLPDGPLEAGLLDVLNRMAPRAERVASICTGAFLLAEVGLLDGRRATTHWRHTDELARRYPAVSVDPDVIHVRDGNRVTSAGISAGIDLALSLVEADHGARAARAVASELVTYMRRPGGQAQFKSAQVAMPLPGSLLEQVVSEVLADPAGEHDVSSMARAAALSPRHLTRLFHAELGATPARWVEQVRLTRAQDLLLAGRTVTSAARDSGFGTDESLRRSFARHLDLSPSEYRQRFASTGDSPSA